uniref:Sperm acrosome associated 6 n=1 Tax=Cavia porcellus TaxID=10141 RepID=A0A286XPR0_CAVPO
MALLRLASAVPSGLRALLVLRASAWACLLCFTTYTERVSICRMFAGLQGPRIDQCKEALTAAFQGLSDMEINYEERSHLHDNFTQMTLSLQEEAAAGGSFEVAFPAAAEKMKRAILELKKGIQEVARRFRCQGCYSTLCDLPLDCPVQDMTLRTRDASYFRDMPRARGSLARIRPVQPTHRGTFCCVIQHDQRPLARLYFFLNVTGPPPRGETELQVVFRKVLRWAPRDVEMIEPWRPSLDELLARPEALTLGNLVLLTAVIALVSATATVLLWMFCRWYLSGD